MTIFLTVIAKALPEAIYFLWIATPTARNDTTKKHPAKLTGHLYLKEVKTFLYFYLGRPKDIDANNSKDNEENLYLSYT